jgi:hypothetical protein
MDQQQRDRSLEGGVYCCLQDDNPISFDQSFWAAVGDPIWKNVVTDIKEALDRRDANQTDPAFYAAVRALESTIKIISDQKGWTHGREKGIHGYIDNLGSATNGAFINESESGMFKYIFTEVQHLAGYGDGSLDTHLWKKSHTKKLMVESLMRWWIPDLIQRI